MQSAFALTAVLAELVLHGGLLVLHPALQRREDAAPLGVRALVRLQQRLRVRPRALQGLEHAQVAEGAGASWCQFAFGRRVEPAVTDVGEAIANIRSDRPQGILQPKVGRPDIACVQNA